MSHRWNDIAYEERFDLYWESYEKFIAEGYTHLQAEKKGMEIIVEDIEKGIASRYLLT